MKILIDARESGTTTGRYIDKLIQYLQEIDKSNEYLVLLKKARFDFYSGAMANNFKVIQCDIKEFSFSEQTKLLWQIIKIKPDIVHFPLVQHPVLYWGKCVIGMLDLTTLRFKNPSKNFVIFWLKQRVYWFVNYVASRKAKKIITISEFVKGDIIKNFKVDSSKIIVTHNSADLINEEPDSITGLVGKKFIMYVGRHQPHKNLERLVEAHQILLKKSPELLLVIVGKKDKTTELLENKINGKGYKNIVFTGFVTDGQLRWLYENTACYVFPSLSEGFGLPGLEAMVHSAPVASSNATCLPEIYGDAAHYFNPLDVEDIANKIDEVLNYKSLRVELMAKGHEQAKKYSWERMANQTLEVYNNALTS